MFFSQEKIERSMLVTSEAAGCSIIFFRKEHIIPSFSYKVLSINLDKLPFKLT